MSINRRRLMSKIKRMARACEPDTPERIFSVKMYFWLRNSFVGIAPPSTVNPALVLLPSQGNQQINSIEQCYSVFDTIMQDELFQ